MKRILSAIIFIASINTGSVNASSNVNELFNLKQLYEQKAFEIKVKQEEEKILQEGKSVFDFYNFDDSFLNKKSLDFKNTNINCAEWVFQGPGTREEAIEACRGVTDMSCVQWIYQGPGTRMEAARACRNTYSIDCAKWVYQGPGTRIEAVKVCEKVYDMSCVHFAYQEAGVTRVDAARSCSSRNTRPPRDRDRCN
ncbi:hypothetical protein [Halobacteriovorax sp.]|uniref:hypothetical protein n=1 Tax=Halobacteriovorax sp. TaxID=2020862 RepID=UPI0035621FCE